MPVLELRLENFRIFRDTGWFRIAPLTCLVGRNSSGKSSVVTALLLLKQSIEQETLSNTVTPLSLNGPYCELGNYSDLVHNHDEKAELAISFRMALVDLADHAEPHTIIPFVNLRIPRPVRFGRYTYYRRSTASGLPKRGAISARFTFAVDEPFGPSLSKVEIEIDHVGTAKFIRTISGERRQHWRAYTTDLPPQSIRLLPFGRTFFPFISIRDKSYVSSAPRTKHRIRTFMASVQLFFDKLASTLGMSEFIGPFRTPPERRYTFGGFSNARSGPSGEQAVDLLITESLLNPKNARPLGDAVSFWIKHLQLADTLDVVDIAKRLNLFEVNVSMKGQGTPANVADVGYGISQVLPVIVQGLLMKPGGIYFVQQPEIHLHPDAQAGLADFFWYLTSYGVTTVIETHSEYFLIRLRRRLAEKAVPLKLGLPPERAGSRPFGRTDLAVLLIDSEGGQGSVNELLIGNSFQFENLPSGFMSQALEDRLALLKAIGDTHV